MRIAVCQMNTVPGDVSGNLHRALALTEQALDLHPDIVLFHEELLVGYVANLAELAERVDGPSTRAFQRALVGRKSEVLWGLTERDGEDLYISAVLVSAHGVRACYRKTHLWWAAEGLRHEPSHYRPGDRLVTFDLAGHRCGVMICYDGDFRELTRAYADLGCGVLFWLNNRASRGHDEVRPLAERNSMVVASACCCGENEVGDHCGGGSNITDHDGQLLTELWHGEGVICADIDPGRALEARVRNPWYSGARPRLYAISHRAAGAVSSSRG